MNIRFGGGLGNQLFQYAFLYAQTMKHPEITYSFNAVMHRNPNEDVRNFSLSNMNISHTIDVYDENEIGLKWTCLLLKRKILRKLTNCIITEKARQIQFLEKFQIIHTEDIYRFFPEIDIDNDNFYVEGAFQSWRYFDEYRYEILKEFTVKPEPSKTNRDILDQIHKCEAVCVHIRRGDFLNSHYAETFAICDFEYYKNAMEYIKSKTNNPVFYIFSNTSSDIAWIKSNYNFTDYNVNYIDLNNSDFEELRLMYSCKHFIISNSTFSWWAQYLGNYEGKIVVAPSRWINENIDTSDIYMSNWNTINV